ncbi:MAG: hypothetical protein Q9222_000320 [Ikaeria aurantiellina]
METRAAWEQIGITSMIYGDGFESRIFTLIVGSEEKAFTAHASYLSQWPVFDRICNGNFQESNTGRINLPDEDPHVVRALLQYLYTGNFLGYGTSESAGSHDTAASQLIDLYVTAEKYQLEYLKRLFLDKFKRCIDPYKRPVDFLHIAKVIYDKVPETDGPWRNFFLGQFQLLPKPCSMSTSLKEEFDDCLSGGGNLAVDLMAAVCLHYENQLKNIVQVSCSGRRKKVKWASLE